LHAGAREADEVGIVHFEGHRWEARLRADKLRRLLVEADIPFGKIRRKVGHDAVQQRRNTSVAAGDTVVEVGEHREIFAVLLERLERRWQRVGATGGLREETLVVGSVVGRHGHQTFDWFFAGALAAGCRRHRFEHWEGDGDACSAQEVTSVESESHVGILSTYRRGASNLLLGI